MKKNKDVIAYIPGLSCHWVFRVTVEGPTIVDSYNDGRRLVTDIFEIFEGFVHPIAVEFVLVDYPEDTELSKLVDVDAVDTHRRICSRGSERSGPLSTGEIFTEMESVPLKSGQRTLKSLTTERAETRINIEDGDQYVDSEDEWYVTWTRKGPVDTLPKGDPIEFVIRLMVRSGENPPWWEVVIRTSTDIWFEESQIGQINRHRLTDKLSTLTCQLEPWEVEYYSDHFYEDAIRKRGFEELLPSEW